MNDKLFSVNEIFSSIEGEGIRTGFLSTFIRLNGCNLRCSYCDTCYALKFKESNMSLQNILDKVAILKNRKITITGGEPLCHPNIKLLVENLSFLGYHVNIETNGSIILPEFCGLPGVFVTMDWKCPSSGQTSKMKNENLRLLTRLDVIKLVVGSQEDLLEAKRIYDLDLPCNFYISPVYNKIDPKEIVEFMKVHDMQNAVLQVQLHKIIWDPLMRGV